jgi:hypothetical protein
MEAKVKIDKRHPIKKMLSVMWGRYEVEALDDVFEGIKKIVENASILDYERIGEFFLELGRNPQLIKRVMKEFEEWGL